jgi:two-component system, chemotaxis family, response regulator Rcp1
LRVLLIEDNPGDVRLTIEAFRTTNAGVNVDVATNGADALALLRKEGDYVDTPRPDLILLDLNLPAMGGREVLVSIKEDERLKTIPTVILTTVEEPADIAMSYQLQANAYVVKPVQLDAFDALVQSISDFWVTQVQLPPEPH